MGITEFFVGMKSRRLRGETIGGRARCRMCILSYISTHIYIYGWSLFVCYYLLYLQELVLYLVLSWTFFYVYLIGSAVFCDIDRYCTGNVEMSKPFGVPFFRSSSAGSPIRSVSINETRIATLHRKIDPSSCTWVLFGNTM